MTQSMPNVASSGWTVTTQRETQEQGPGGRFIKGIEVGFVTGQGVAGTVFVPAVSYNPPTVSAMITEKAAQIDAITGLSVPPQG